MCLEIFDFKPRRENLTGLLFCLDWSLSRSTDHRDRNLHSLFHRFQSSRLGHAVRPTILRLFIFECKHVKSARKEESRKQLRDWYVSAPVSKMFDCLRDGLEMKEPVDVLLSMSDPATLLSNRNLLSLVDLPSPLGHLISYLLTQFAFRTVRY